MQSASESLIARARDLMFHNGGTFNTALAAARAMNPDLVKLAAMEAQGVQIANSADRAKGRKERADAGAEINDAVHDRMRKFGETHDVAWHTVTTKTHRSLAQFANSGGASDGFTGSVPGLVNLAPKPAALPKDAIPAEDRSALCLPYDVTQDEFDVARKAAGGTKSPNWDAMFNALARWHASDRDVSIDVAKAFCMGRFGALSSMVSPDAKPSFAVRSSQGKSYTV